MENSADASISRLIRQVGLVLVVGFLLTPQAWTAEVIADRHVADVLAPELARGEHHFVREIVTSDGYLDHYEVQVGTAARSVVGRRALLTLIRELAAMDEIDRLSKTKVFVESAAAAGVNTVKSVAGAVVDPKATFQALPKGVGRLFKRTRTTVERGIREANEKVSGEAETGPEAMVTRNAQVSEAERKWAKKLGVDPYSLNLDLREAVSRVALVDSAASFTVGLAVPGVASIGLDILAELSDDVWNRTPAELEAANRNRMIMAGIKPSDVSLFLNSLWYTPTWQTIVAASLQALADVEGAASLMQPLVNVTSYDEARFVMQSTAMLARYHGDRQSIDRVVADSRLPHAVDSDGRHVVLLAVDYLFATEQTLAAAERLREGAPNADHELWLTGGFTVAARNALQESGWAVNENSMGELMARMELR